jgi:hypothetical protein
MKGGQTNYINTVILLFKGSIERRIQEISHPQHVLVILQKEEVRIVI